MKKYIIMFPDGKMAGPISEQQLENDLQKNILKAETLVFCINSCYVVAEKHESYLAPQQAKKPAPPVTELEPEKAN